ncbi:MAG: hypothetical protein MK066_00540 [Crocinitomicaceae bacterium]|nr:hypothetical protein [Crocinitomicaceae bacterium]
MEERDKFDLQQYTAKPVSRRYLYRILFYVALLVIASLFVFLYKGKSTTPEVSIESDQPATEIEGVTIITE